MAQVIAVLNFCIREVPRLRFLLAILSVCRQILNLAKIASFHNPFHTSGCLTLMSGIPEGQ
jgi:hypothetical protein